MQKKTFQTLALVAIAMLGTNAFSGQIKNGLFPVDIAMMGTARF